MPRLHSLAANAISKLAPPAAPRDLLHSAEFWTAVSTGILALATVALIVIGASQIAALKRQNRRWQTLAACDRYNFDPILDNCLKTVRDAKAKSQYENKEKEFRLEITTILNYLDGIAIGIYQGLYIEDLARDHLHNVVIGHVNEFLRDGMPKKIDIDIQEFQYVLALSDRWTRISRPRFREKEWKFLPWRRSQ